MKKKNLKLKKGGELGDGFTVCYIPSSERDFGSVSKYALSDLAKETKNVKLSEETKRANTYLNLVYSYLFDIGYVSFCSYARVYEFSSKSIKGYLIKFSDNTLSIVLYDVYAFYNDIVKDIPGILTASETKKGEFANIGVFIHALMSNIGLAKVKNYHFKDEIIYSALPPDATLYF